MTLTGVRPQQAPSLPQETARGVHVSVIVPLTERPEPLVELYREYAGPLRDAIGPHFEFVFVADPWFQHMVEPLRELARQGEPIRVLQAGQSVGETSLVRVAADHSRGDIVLTLPSYRRVEAVAVPLLLEAVEAGVDVAVGRRWPRRDGLVNRMQGRVFNALTGRLSAGRIRDIGSGVRAIRRSVLQELPLYGDFIRFLPILAYREGYRVEEIPVPQHPADRTSRIYRPGVYLRRIIDVLGLFFLIRFTEKPLRFFGMVGGVLFGGGGFLLTLLTWQRLLGQGIANRPLLLLGVLLIVLGVQAVAMGLIGEIIVHLHAPERRPYRVQGSSGDG